MLRLPPVKKRFVLLLILAGFLWGLNWLLPLSTSRGEGADGWSSLPSDQVIRLHVVANSDDAADQALKYRVRDEIVAALGPLLAPAGDCGESRELVRQRLPEVVRLAEETVRREGFDYPVQAELGRFAFPPRLYGELYFPAGEYEALRVVIGKGEGANWWCVLFPPLCFVGTASGSTLVDGSGEVMVPAIAVPHSGFEQDLPAPRIRWKLLEIGRGLLDR